ncbi:hypothetical protein EVG20_g9886 [Dentipellis fragilis]|uniref:Uncharacterized protein n=1 Tax=Dentipellis fragilis TaxID=205917 RepID=A0A4Y9XZF4_9AGAM|nr:hypothetical protein EVG20_g9886 [Dentipellis fragilis]
MPAPWAPSTHLQIDLDCLTFYANNMPIFRLDNMPPGPILGHIKPDTYGHAAPQPSIPRNHVYAWKSNPPQMDGQLLEEYTRRCNGGQPLLDIDSLLMMPSQLSPGEALHVRLLEVLVNHCLLHCENAYSLRELAKVPHRDRIPILTADTLLSVAYFMADPFASYQHRLPPQASLADHLRVQWLRKNIRMMLWTHLDDDANLHAASAVLARSIDGESASERVVYGILFSGIHVAIVRIDKDEQKLTHTEALPFLPSNFTSSPSTPGITALGRLLSLEDPETLSKLRSRLSVSNPKHSKLEELGVYYATGGVLDRLNTEALACIQSHLPDTTSWVMFSLLCPRTAQLPTRGTR